MEIRSNGETRNGRDRFFVDRNSVAKPIWIWIVIRHQLNPNPDCEFCVWYFSGVRGVCWLIEHGYRSVVQSIRNRGS
jgi:hypothetical protein